MTPQIAPSSSGLSAGNGDQDPKTKVSRLPKRAVADYRPRRVLTAEQTKTVKTMMKSVWDEWRRNTSRLRDRLRLYNDRMEGVKEQKDFPWRDSSNIHVPMVEKHSLIAHSITTATVLDNDPIYICKMVDPSADSQPIDPMIERFLHRELKSNLKIDVPISRGMFNAFQHPLSILVVDWMEEYGKQFDVRRYASTDEFIQDFPTPKDAGLSEDGYTQMIERILVEGEIALRVEERVVTYRGPSVREVELKDFVWAPAAAPNLGYCVFVGDKFVQRDAYYRTRANRKWFDKDEVEKLLKGAPRTTAMDDITQQQNRIEGVGTQNTSTSKEYLCIQGNLRIDLDGDGEEELYPVVYAPEQDCLLRIEDYPYWHNRSNYIPLKIRSRSNRLLGRCFNDMLFDLNEEADTQHNQRIDSRTITIVPTFKKLSTSDVDLARKDQRFYPGMTITVKRMDEFQQLEVTQTDMSSSLQEESVLNQMAEELTGVSSLRTGKESPKDPRAPAKKVQSLISQSNQRIDAYIKEFKPGLDEVGAQSLELFYQFSPDAVIKFADIDSQTGQWVQQQVERAKLRNRHMAVEIGRTTIMDNPEQIAQRALVRYQIWSKEPLVGGVAESRHELVKRTMIDTREKNITKLLPELPKQMGNIAKQDALSDPSMPQSVQKFGQSLQDQKGGSSKEPNGSRKGGPDTSLPTYTKGAK